MSHPITEAASLLGITAERTLERVADILCPGEPLTDRGREMAMAELGIIDTLLAAVERLEKAVAENLCPRCELTTEHDMTLRNRHPPVIV